MPPSLRILVALLALLSLLAARHLHRRQRAAGAAHPRLVMPLGTLPVGGRAR
ncbi:hypothetical protein [Hymenobacter bucti]|uniref:Uncharacterized protein n=1 Tax=Hymenobacter bucti TaxID=1844114 RepID=A0ABW4QP02_9BACT